MKRLLLHILTRKPCLFSRKDWPAVPTVALRPLGDTNFANSSKVASARLLLFKVAPFPFVIIILLEVL